METYCNYLFVYGTLMDNDNGFAVYLKNNSIHYTDGYFNGKLYDLGEYPGAIYEPDNKGKVYGRLFRLDDDPYILKIIDEYESFGENEVQPNLFIRMVIPVTTTMGIVNCWAYLYNLPIAGRRQIMSGRYN